MKYAGDYIVIPNIYYGRFLGLALAIMTMAGAFNTLVLVIAGYFVDQLLMRFVMPRQYRLRRRQLCSESILALCAKAMCAGGEVTATAMQALRKQLLIVGGQQQMVMDIVRREQQSLEGFEEHAARLVQMLAHHPDDL